MLFPVVRKLTVITQYQKIYLIEILVWERRFKEEYYQLEGYQLLIDIKQEEMSSEKVVALLAELQVI